MNSVEHQTQHTHANDKPEELRACLICHKRSRKSKSQKMVEHSLWPQGDTTVKGTRGLSEADRVLQERITEQILYRDKLEKALAELQKSISSEPHPLLAEKLQVRVPGLSHEKTAQITDSETKSLPPDIDGDELVDAFGIMSIQNDGKRQFHGETATSEYLLKDNIEPPMCPGQKENLEKRTLHPLRLPPELILANVQFPCPPMDQPPLDVQLFLTCLPCHERGLILFQNYLSYFGWCSMPIPRDNLEEIFGHFYPEGSKTSTLSISDAHGLAVLFMVFVLGVLYDINTDISELATQTEEFHSLARAAMTADPVTEHTTIQSVQALVLMIWYFRMFPGQRSLSYQWALSGFLNKLVQAIGLHRDSSKRITEPNDRIRFEQTFWEFNCVDTWQESRFLRSYMFGRPTSMITAMVDCKIPDAVLVTHDHDPSFYIWKYSYSRLVSDIIGHTSSTTTNIGVGQTRAAPVVYSDIIRSENLLREHYIPSNFAWPEHDETLPADESVGKLFQRFLGNVWRQISIMYLHRRYFWVAILQHAYNPSQSPYVRSVAAVFHSAISIVRGMRRLWRTHPRLIERMCPFWSHCMSAALVLGALVAKSPGCRFAETALLHFDETYEMFEEAKASLQPRNAKTAMWELQRRAHGAFARFHDTADQLNTAHRPSVERSISPSDAQYPLEAESYAPRAGFPEVDSMSFPDIMSILSPPGQDTSSTPYGLFGDLSVEYDMAQSHVGM